MQLHAVDVMHNIYLGTAKHVMTLLQKLDILTPSILSTAEARVAKMKVPSSDCNMAGRVSAGFGGFQG